MVFAFVLSFFALSAYAACGAGGTCGSVPTDGCDLNSSKTFAPGTYNLPHGVDVCATNVTLNCNGATFHNNTGDANTVGVYTAAFNTTILNCTMKNYQTGFRFNNAQLFTISNSGTVANMGTNSVDINNVNGGTVTGNNFSSNVVAFDSDGLNISNNIMPNGGINIFFHSRSNMIVGNTAKSILLRGTANTHDVSGNIVQGNTLQTIFPSTVIEIENGGGNTIQGNNVSGSNDSIGIYDGVNNNVLSNTLSGGAGFGILTENSSGTFVSNNTISNKNWGIVSFNGTDEVTRDNIVFANAIGLFIKNHSNVEIKNNEIRNNLLNLKTEIDPINPTRVLDVTDNYWGMTNPFGKQDCDDIDASIFDSEEGGAVVNFSLIFEQPGGPSVDKCTPILLIHGIYSDDTIWNGIVSDELTKEGMRYSTIGFENGQVGLVPNNGAIENYSPQIHSAINSILARTGETNVDVVAHSMGGLATRYYVNTPLYNDTIRNMIMLGTPNEGAPIARTLSAKFMGWKAGNGNDLARVQMYPHSPFLTSLNAAPANPEITYRAIAGTALPSNFLVKLAICAVVPDYCFSYDTDSIVPTRSVNIPQLDKCYQADVTHADPLGPSYYTDGSVATQLPRILKGLPPNLDQCSETLAAFIGENIQIDQTSGIISGNQVQIPFANVSNGNIISASLTWKNANLHIGLVSPTGQDINVDNYHTIPEAFFETGTFDGNTIEWITIPNPATGNWSIKVKAENAGAPVNYDLTLFRRITAQITASANKFIYAPNDTMLLTARLFDQGYPVFGGGVFTTVTLPNAQTSNVRMFDDGLHNDWRPNDGIYGGAFTNTTQVGPYIIEMIANGTSAGSGAFHLKGTTSVFVN